MAYILLLRREYEHAHEKQLRAREGRGEAGVAISNGVDHEAIGLEYGRLMTRPPDAPPGLIPIPMKGATLLLTGEEYTRAIRRGKWWRRQQEMQGRDARPRREDHPGAPGQHRGTTSEFGTASMRQGAESNGNA
jgi:hypothetical protein